MLNLDKIVTPLHDLNLGIYDTGSELYKGELCIIIGHYRAKDHMRNLQDYYVIKSLRTGNTSNGILIGMHVRLIDTSIDKIDLKTLSILFEQA